jgi:acetyl esterase/lipase
MLGVTDEHAGMEGSDDFAGVSSRVQAVVMFDGIADFETNYAGEEAELESVHGITSFEDPLVKQLSPITYVTADDPTFLVIASESDHFRAQADQLQSALENAGAQGTRLDAEGATHCNFANSGVHSKEAMPGLVAEFFRQNLK